tara:strand:- start:176 stop:400 length:225 start_codon:yes stop_codon:yes gene_type:complete
MPKSHIVVSSEGDLETGVEYVTKLALSPGSDKKLSITFPSKDMMDIFMTNLFTSFIVNRVPKDNSLDIVLNIPE